MDPLAPPAQLRTIIISGITIHLTKRLKRSLHVKLVVDGTDSRSILVKQQKQLEKKYSLETSLNLRDGSILSVTVEEKHSVRRDKTLAQLDVPLTNISSVQAPSTLDNQSHTMKYQIHLSNPKQQIWLNYTMVQTPEEIQEQLRKNKAIQGAAQKLREFKTALDKLDGVGMEKALRITAVVNELHPIAQAVVDGVGSIHDEAFKTEDNHHNGVAALAENMVQVLNLTPSLEKITSLELKEIIIILPNLMDEIVEFIEGWLADGAAKPSDGSNHEVKIGNLKGRLDEFNCLVMLESKNLKKSKDLDDLKKLLNRIIEVQPQAAECLDGTRINILSNIEDQMAITEDENILWIRGAPGSGKSSISLTLKSRLHKQGRLLTYFRFDRSDATVTIPSALWSCVAYDLAVQFPSVLENNLSLLKDNQVNLTSTMELFTSLVEGPLTNLTDSPPNYPLVIIIDALDECGGLKKNSLAERNALLQTLKRWQRVPKHFKLLITSREEGDIVRELSHVSGTVNIPSGYSLLENPNESAYVEASRDIQILIEKQLRGIRERFPSLPLDWPGRNTIAEIGVRAAGNFMWATAAMDFIDSEYPQERLGSILSQTPESVRPLHSLYSTILDTSFGNLVPTSLGVRILRVVLGTTIFARRPFGIDEYTKLKLPANIVVKKNQVESIRDRLRSVIDQGPTLRFVHKSFDDFLLSEECPPKYAIDQLESQDLLTKLCLTTMEEELHFNLCNLETSCLMNVDIPDIEIKVRNGISKLLSYSCSFWADHLTSIPLHNKLVLNAKDVLRQKLLYWFEAMSLLKEMTRVSHALLSVLDWSKSSSDEDFKDFVYDACQFIGTFIHPITQSAAHIYISALPFAPEHSLVAKCFLPQFPRILSLSMGKQTNWSSCIFTSDHNKFGINCVAFSPDEKLFVAGSEDGTICVCDSMTGYLIAGPFLGSFSISGICFSPDGQRVWAAFHDGQVIGWDVDTGNQHLAFTIGEPGQNLISNSYFDGGFNIVSVSCTWGIATFWSAETGERLRELVKLPDEGRGLDGMYSPDGTYLAWRRSGDMVMRIWNLSERSGEVESLNLQGSHTTCSISTDGRYLVSGSQEGVILVHDVKTGEILGHPLITGMGAVFNVAYSHCSGLIASTSEGLDSDIHLRGLYQGTLTVWSASTHEIVLRLEGHTSLVREIVFMRDGRRVLSTSSDGTARMWDLGAAGKGPLHEFHATSTISTIAVDRIIFSPCGKTLASLHYHQIRTWDTTTWEELLCPINRLRVPVKRSPKIIFSPSGSQLVIHDGETLQIWNVVAGEPDFRQDVADDVGVRFDMSRQVYLTFQPTDHRLVTCSQTGIIRAWRPENGVLAEEFISSPQPEDVNNHAWILALSPDGLIVLVRDANRTPRHYLWSTTTCQPLSLPLTFPHDKTIVGAAFSPNGKLLAISLNDILQTWDIRSGECTEGYLSFGRRIHYMRQLVFSSDNCHIACFDSSSIIIWDTRTSRQIATPWVGHVERLLTVAFSPDGTKLVSGSFDGQIRIWDTTDLIEESDPSVGFLEVGTCLQDGWVTDKEGGLLFWAPNDHRGRLEWPRNVAVIGGRGIPTRLDFTKFRYAENWTECFEPEK